jgi:hypothetical protein
MFHEGLEAAKQALAKNLQMGEIQQTHGDYESSMSSRIFCYLTLSNMLREAERVEEAHAAAQAAVEVGEKLFRSSPKENTKAGIKYLDTLFTYLNTARTYGDIQSAVKRVSDVRDQMSVPLSRDQERIIKHYESLLDKKKREIDASKRQPAGGEKENKYFDAEEEL